jgi:DNA repair protein RecO (recombination protein O)
MSEILTTEALVLTKIDFGDSSNIVSFFTKDYGIISAIIKGGKTAKSGKSKVINPPNHLNLVIYNKNSREVQIVSGVDIISHYPKIKEDLDKLKFAYAILELLKKLLPEHEANLKIFRGTVRILDLLENPGEPPVVIFGRFFMFILKEIGYEIQLEKCASCGKTNDGTDELSCNYEIGILCRECGHGHLHSFIINAELFRYLICLKNRIIMPNPGKQIPEMAIGFMENYLRYHLQGFQGIQTFQIFK